MVTPEPAPVSTPRGASPSGGEPALVSTPRGASTCGGEPEDRGREDISVEELNRRLAERAELAATLRATRPTLRLISGEGSALDDEPAASEAGNGVLSAPLVSIRERRAAQEGGAPRQPRTFLPDALITGDFETLAVLIAEAQEMHGAWLGVERKVEPALLAALEARRRLDDYLRENGIS